MTVRKLPDDTDARRFREAIAALNTLRRGNFKNTEEYRYFLRVAERTNPNPQTPIGFYLD